MRKTMRAMEAPTRVGKLIAAAWIAASSLACSRPVEKTTPDAVASIVAAATKGAAVAQP